MCCAVPMGSGLGERGPYTATGLAGSVASRPAVRSAGGGEPRGTVLAPLAWLDADQPPIPGESRAREPDDCADAQARGIGGIRRTRCLGCLAFVHTRWSASLQDPWERRSPWAWWESEVEDSPAQGLRREELQPCSRLMAGTPPGAARRGGGAGTSASALDVSGLGSPGSTAPGRPRPRQRPVGAWGPAAATACRGASWHVGGQSRSVAGRGKQTSAPPAGAMTELLDAIGRHGQTRVRGQMSLRTPSKDSHPGRSVRRKRGRGSKWQQERLPRSAQVQLLIIRPPAV